MYIYMCINIYIHICVCIYIYIGRTGGGTRVDVSALSVDGALRPSAGCWCGVSVHCHRPHLSS